MVILCKKRGVRRLKIPLNVKFHNEYEIVVKDVKTGKVTQRGKGYNAVLSNFGTRLASSTSVGTSIAYGSGSGTLELSRTTLFNYVGHKASSQIEQSFDEATGIYQQKRSILITTAEHIGVTFTEVGIGGTTVYTHAFIEDSEGNPISIGPKTDTQEITIFMTFYWKILSYNEPWFAFPIGDGFGEHISARNGFLEAFPNNGTIVVSHMHVGEGKAPSTLRAATINTLGGPQTVSAMQSGSKRVFTSGRLNSGDSNGHIREIGFSRTLAPTTGPTFRILVEKLPSGVWNGIQKNNIAIGTGDGALTDFNFPYYEPVNAVIKVDGITKSENTDYVLYAYGEGKNITWTDVDDVEIYSSVWDRNLTQTEKQNFFSTGSFTTGWNNTINDYATIDLKTNQKWNATRFYIRSNSPSHFINKYDLELSSDGVSWTKVLTDQTTGSQGNASFESQAVNMSFRYVKVTCKGTQGNGLWSGCYLNVGRKQLIFSSPPANVAPITADCNVKYIPKDSLHVLDISHALNYGAINPI